MNAPTSDRDGGGSGSSFPSEPPEAANDGQMAAYPREEMPSVILSRASMLAKAGVPVNDIKKILDGHYDLWDDETVSWEERFPEKGKRVMDLLREVYDFPFGRTSVPSDTNLRSLVQKAFCPPSPGPLPRSHRITLVSAVEFERIESTIQWLGAYTAPKGGASSLDEAFPWAPVASSLQASGRFEFGVYDYILHEDLRKRLWRSLTLTLRNLWLQLDGAASVVVKDPFAVRDLWIQGNCLPIGFSLAKDSFIFLLTRS